MGGKVAFQVDKDGMVDRYRTYFDPREPEASCAVPWDEMETQGQANMLRRWDQMALQDLLALKLRLDDMAQIDPETMGALFEAVGDLRKRMTEAEIAIGYMRIGDDLPSGNNEAQVMAEAYAGFLIATAGDQHWAYQLLTEWLDRYNSGATVSSDD